MNKYTLGTILGSALLGLTKNKFGSPAKLKKVCSIDAMIGLQVDLYFSIVPIFGRNFKKLVALTKRAWDNLPKTEITLEQQSSEQQSSWEQQSSEQDDGSAPKYRFEEGGKTYEILFCDLFLTVQQMMARRIEQMVNAHPDFNLPDGYDWGIDYDMMGLWSEEPEGYNELVNNQEAYFWLNIYRSQDNYTGTCPSEDEVQEELDNLLDEVWDRIHEICFETLNEEFFLTRWVANGADHYHEDITVSNWVEILKNGKWVPYNSPKTKKSKLRKR